MSGTGNQPEWHVRIDRQYVFNKPGQGAHEKADELSSGKTELQKFKERLLGVRTDESSWRRGAVGEEAVGARLDRLPRERWAVIHDLTIGTRGANLDHLVVGPPGIFAINTKHLRGNVTVYDRAILQNGHKTDFVPKALREARTVQGRLGAALGQPLRAWGVLVIMGAAIQVRKRPADLTVLSANDVPAWFVQLPGETIDRGLRLTLERLARSPDTWLPPRRPQPPRETPPPRPPSTAPVDGLVVRRWRRFGKDRLYVNTRGGETLGYRDLTTGDVHPVVPEHRPLIERATANWRRDAGSSPR